MEDYTGKTNEDLLELLEDLNEQQEMFEDDLDDPDYKNMYDKNAEEIIKIKEALNEAESSTIDSEPMEEEVSMPVEAEDSMSMEEIEVYMPEEDEDKLSTDLDQNTLDEIEDDEREFAEETGSNKSEQIERMNEQLNEMLGPKPTESKREVEENLDNIKFSDINIDNSLFFAEGGKTKIGIMKDDEMYAKGGNIDYFEQYELLEKEYPKIYDVVNEQGELTDYNDTERLLNKLNSMGWTFDYGLDNSPYDLRPFAPKVNMPNYKDYAKGGEVEDKYEILVYSDGKFEKPTRVFSGKKLPYAISKFKEIRSENRRKNDVTFLKNNERLGHYDSEDGV